MRFPRRGTARLAAAVAFALLTQGCLKLSDLSETERLFPDSALTGAVARASVRDVVEYKGADGTELSASALIPENPATEQLKPSALTILKRLKEKYPDAKAIRVTIYDDERAAALGLPVATAAYDRGTVTVAGGLPTDAEVAAVNAARSGKEDLLPFARPREEDFNIALKVHEFSAADPASTAPPGTAPAVRASNAEGARKAASFFRIPHGRVKTAMFNLSTWYGMHRGRKLHEAR